MASIPAWFDYETYMANKLAQMQKADTEQNNFLLSSGG